jgi:lipopolysaccharide/colanic/teichoic acid biosynthesis glycosyltransferase
MFRLSDHEMVSPPELASELLKDVSKGDLRDMLKVKGPEYAEHPAKRIVDLAIAAPASVLALPVGIVAAIGSQRETGAWRYQPVRQGHQLEKLRTIIPGQEPNGVTAVEIPGLGPWGERLRDGLDELPHLYLVLRGLGSIVGPRALNEEAREARRRASPVLFDEFIERASLEARNVRLLPGMIDPPSIHGHEHPKDASDEMFRTQMRLGLDWIDNTSVLNDFKVVRQAARVRRHKPSRIESPELRPYEKVA